MKQAASVGGLRHYCGREKSLCPICTRNDFVEYFDTVRTYTQMQSMGTPGKKPPAPSVKVRKGVSAKG
jgi:hypothetical protein